MADDNKAKIIVDGDVSPLKRKLREASDEMRRFGATAGRDLDGLGATVMRLTSRFTALGAVLSIGGLTAMARQAIDAADSLNDLAQRTQTSVRSLASFKLIAEQSGTNIESLGKGLNKLSVFMAENEAAAKKLGITARDPVQAFIQFADALGRAATPQDRAAIANKVLGKSFQDLLPLLREGADSLRDAAKASEEYAQKLEKLAPRADTFNDRLAVMKLRWDALKVSMGSAFLDMMPNAWTMDATSARMIELRAEIGRLQRALQDSPGSGLLHKWMYGTKAEIESDLATAQRELAKLEEMKKAAAASGSNPGGGPLTFSDIEPSPNKKAKSPQYTDGEWSNLETEHLKKTLDEINQIRLEYEHAGNEAIKKADEKLLKDTTEIYMLRVEAAKNAEMDRIAAAEAAAQHELDLGNITQQEYLAMQEQFNQQRLAAEERFLAAKQQIAAEDPEQNVVELERLELEKAEISRRYREQDLEIQRQMAMESKSIWDDLGNRMSSLWEKGVNALINGTLTFRNALRAIGAEIVGWFAKEVVGKMIKDWIAGEAKKLLVKMGFLSQEKAIEKVGAAQTVATKAAEATAVAGANAVEAGTGAAASQASIPIVGPALALEAMAAVFGAVMAMGSKVKSASRGYDIPRGVNPMTQLHEEEMVLPSKYANTIRNMAAGEGGQSQPAEPPINLSVSAVDAAGVKRFLMDNRIALADALKAAARDFKR